MTSDEFIEEAKTVHNNFYDYSLVEHTTKLVQKNKIDIICPDHGIFRQTPLLHKRGNKCPQCAKNGKRSKEDYIREFKVTHGDKYTYDKWLADDAEYKATSTIIVTCPIHKDFSISIHNHKSGSGCPQCAVDSKRKSRAVRLAEAEVVHGQKYDYSAWMDGTNHNNKSLIPIRCPKHGVFHQSIDKHINQGTGCPECSRVWSSKGEQEIAELIEQLGFTVVRRTRSILPDGKELDIYVPDQKIAIEYCGTYWHSDAHERITPRYHFDKMDSCNKLGIRLLTIFSDEWNDKRQIVTNKIKTTLNQNDQPKINARQCSLHTPTSEEKVTFFNTNHIQGTGPGSVTYALQHNGNTVAMMTFIEKANQVWVLNRYATNCHVRGGFSKLLAHFCKNHTWNEIISFADRRWSTGEMYYTNGFQLDGELPPDYTYAIGNKRVHKFNFRHSRLPSFLGDLYDPTTSEVDNMRKAGYYRVWNCGLLRFVKRKSPD